jgi:Cupin
VSFALDSRVDKNPTKRIAAPDLDRLNRLITTLEVDFVMLAECVVGPGWRLSVGPKDTPSIHYNLTGTGRMIVDKWPPIPLSPHTLAILPPRTAFRIEVDHDSGSALRTVESGEFPFEPGKVRRVVAGDGGPYVIVICGYFTASYGASMIFSRGCLSRSWRSSMPPINSIRSSSPLWPN